MKILFVSKKAYAFYDVYNSANLIIDYFDIEVQKILDLLGFKYKRNPKIVSKNLINRYEIAKIINLDKFSPTNYISTQSIAVLYDCF